MEALGWDWALGQGWQWDRQVLGQSWHWDRQALGWGGAETGRHCDGDDLGQGWHWDRAGTGTGRHGRGWHWDGLALGAGQAWVPGGTAPRLVLLAVSRPGDEAWARLGGIKAQSRLKWRFGKWRCKSPLLPASSAGIQWIVTATDRAITLPPSPMINIKYFPFFSAFVKLVFVLIRECYFPLYLNFETIKEAVVGFFNDALGFFCHGK